MSTIVEVREDRFEIWGKGFFTGEYMKLEVLGELSLSGIVPVRNLFNDHIEYVKRSEIVILESE